MARQTFPAEASRLVYFSDGQFGTPLRGAAGVQYRVFTDADASVLANITDADNAPISDSTIRVSSESLLPTFHGPSDGAVVLYIQQINPRSSSPITVIQAVGAGGGDSAGLDAEIVDRIAGDDALDVRVTLLETGGAAGARNGSQGSPALQWPMDHLLGFQPNFSFTTSSHDPLEPAWIDRVDDFHAIANFKNVQAGYWFAS